MMKEGLLYQKAKLKGYDQLVVQFILTEPFRHKTVLACHDDFNHIGMERTSGLLQEGFFWPKRAEDV